MSFEYLTNIALEKAQSDYLEKLAQNGFSGGEEIVPVSESCGRYTSRAVYAYICAPHYASSAMDGIAVLAKNTFGATETTPVTLTQDQYVVVDTGDPLPDNCDAVIMVEELVKNDDGTITIRTSAAPWQHIRQIGEDICAGEMILPSYTKITPAAVGSLIAGGVAEISVIRRPLVGIIPTGDEIVPPCSNPKCGDILEFNSSIFSGMLQEWKCETKTYPIVKDIFEDIKNMLERACSECDMVIINAGSSAGRDDYSTRAISEIGEVLYHGIAIKPGKPTILGYRNSTPVIGVPGYPVSGIIAVEKIVKPLVDAWYHSSVAKEDTLKATLSRTVVSGLKYEEYVRVRLGYVNDKLVASPLSRGAGVVSSFMKADGMLKIPQSCEGYEAGEEVDVTLLKDEKALKNTLVIIGSHDPLLDELGDMIHRRDSSIFVSSTHVGSMGGIMAIKRGETHVAGCHLLDTESGEYNVAFMRKYFPDRNVKIIRCVGRQQGLMIAKGNPLNITEFKDVADGKVRYVNRQKGSGTRILMDYLVEKNGLSIEDIYGYEREEMTHTAVAAQIVAGSADAGMGIYSAAMLYGLDFIPICIEEYDLLIPDYAENTDSVKMLYEVLKSEEFKEKILSLGGYTIDNPGEEISY